MKKKVLLYFLALTVFLTTSMIPVGVFAEGLPLTVSITGYVSVDPVWGFGAPVRFQEFPDAAEVLEGDVKVEVLGTSLSTVTDEYGYFEISNIPIHGSDAGYKLKFSRTYLDERTINIEPAVNDVKVTMKIKNDLNGDGAINMSDMMIIATLYNTIYPSPLLIRGYTAPNFEASNTSNPELKSNFKVEIAGTALSTTTDENGHFKFLGVPKSSEKGYTLKISKTNYLTTEVKIESFQDDVEISSKVQPLKMLVGDINGDNVVNITDIMMIAGSFNTRTGDADFKVNLDINEDGVINMSDISLAAQSFNKGTQTIIIKYSPPVYMT